MNISNQFVDKHTFSLRIRKAMLPLLLMEILMIALMAWQILVMRNALLMVDYSNQVISKANRTYSLSTNLADLQHIYILSDFSKILNRYKTDSAKFQSEFKDLLNMVSDNPEQVNILKQLKRNYLLWKHSADNQMMELQPPFKNTKVLSLKLNSPAQNKLNLDFQIFINNERILRQSRSEWAKKSVLITLIELLSIGAILGILLSFSAKRQMNSLASIYEEALQLSAARYKELERTMAFRDQILNNAFVAVASIDREGKFTLINKHASEILGYPEESLLNEPFNKVLPEEERERINEYFQNAIFSGQPLVRTETKIIHQDGSQGEIAFGWAPLLDQGEIIGLVASGEDIVEKKRLENQLLQAQKLESIGRLAGGVAHDFNNILTAIYGYIELAQEALEENDPFQNTLLQIQRSAESAASLTRQLLSFARKQMISPRLVNLNTITEGLIPMLHRLIGENIQIRYFPESTIPKVKMDTGQFEQLLMNLVLNARDAMKEGGVITLQSDSVSIDILYAAAHEGIEPGNYVRLTVSDTGEGMEETVQQHIFEPFFTTKELGHGTGLGLATCYGIVKQMGGNIWVYSEVGKGTTFRIYLPVSEDEIPTVMADHPIQKTTGNETILIVEDDPSVRTLSVQVLRELGYRVLEASHGKEGLEMAIEHPDRIDLIITDVIMPYMSGKEMIELTLKKRSDFKVLYVSGYSDNLQTEAGNSYRLNSFLSKPFTPTLLAIRVRESLDGEQMTT